MRLDSGASSGGCRAPWPRLAAVGFPPQSPPTRTQATPPHLRSSKLEKKSKRFSRGRRVELESSV